MSICEELKGKYLVVSGIKEWVTTSVCNYQIVEAVYLGVPESLEQLRENAIRIVKNHMPTADVEDFFSYEKTLRLINDQPWTKALMVEHNMEKRWFGFIPADNVGRLFEPNETFNLKSV